MMNTTTKILQATSTAAAAAKQQQQQLKNPISLYRALLRQGKHIHDYNFRSYALRRIKAGFQQQKELQGDDAVMAMTHGREQLKVLQRQATVSALYPSTKSVME